MPKYTLPPIMVEVHLPGFLTAEVVDLDLSPEFPDLISTGDQVGVARFVLNKEPRAMSYRRFIPTGWNRKDYVDKGIVYIGPATIRYRDEILRGRDPSEAILRSNVKCNDYKAIIRTHGMSSPFDPETDKIVNV